jgi:DNA-binding transcriptional LysR family regulator
VTEQPIWRLKRNGELIELHVAGSLQSDSSAILRDAALAGIGLVVPPVWMIGEDVAAGRLVPLLPLPELALLERFPRLP